MEKLLKFLRKLNQKERLFAEELIFAVRTDALNGYDVKKLTGYVNVYRVRAKDIRVIFMRDGEQMVILDIGRRSEKTYKDY